MGLWPFGKKKDDRSVEALLDQANEASPTGAAAGAQPVAPGPVAPGQTGDGTFRLPVEDVFLITGRGVVVTGRVESGVGRIGLNVNVVRGGGVIASSKINGIEMFRKVMDTANPGDNVGLLLDGMSREQLSRGDVIQG
jgi:translation elongation factor EF-Tu-like GTPase